MAERRKKLKFENARIIFRNFSGKETKFNRVGMRNFCVVIEDPQKAIELMNDGWNIKMYQPEEGDPLYRLPVAVSYMHVPPKCYLVINGKITELDEDSIGELDYASIQFCDISINPSPWEVNGKSGIKAYLNVLYANVEPEAFADKYVGYNNEIDSTDDDIPF